jgi:flagellar basal-body rod protein FlgG
MAYTKSGSLSISPEGYLVDGSGNRVMGADGAVQFEEGTAVEQVRITADGSVLVDNQEFAQVALYEVDLQQADWTDGGLVAADADAAVLLEQPGNVVIGGALEQANVDITRELTELIRASRMYQVNQTTLKVQDKAAKIASTSVGEG